MDGVQRSGPAVSLHCSISLTLVAPPPLPHILTFNTYCVFWSYCFPNIPCLYNFYTWKRKKLTVISINDHYEIPFSLEFFASLFKAGRVSNPESEQTTVEQGQIFQAEPSCYASSPSIFEFQPNGAETKQASKQLANRRRRTRKHKKNWDFFLWLH